MQGELEGALSIRYAQIPDGAADIARILALNPKETLWDYSYVAPPRSGLALPDSLFPITYKGITSLIRGEAEGLSLRLYPGFLENQQEHIGVGRVTQVTMNRPDGNIFSYPHDSVPHNIENLILARPELERAFTGKTFVPLFATDDYQTVSRKLGGRTLVSSEDAVRFNSKIHVFEDAAENGYNVSPFVVVRRFEDLLSGLKAIEKKAESLGLDASQTKYWVKFDSLVGGLGVRPFHPAKDSFGALETWVSDVTHRSGLDCDKHFMPLLIDIDVGSLPHIRTILTNANVQAVVAPDGPVITGTTFQKVSEEGKYQGGHMPLTEENKALGAACEPMAIPVLQAAWKQGYRGYAGVDVLLCSTGENTAQAYILEMNARLNGSTSMLSLSHWHNRKLGTEAAATNISFPTRPVDSFSDLARHFNSVMYRGEKSGEEGIVPIVLKSDPKNRINSVKTIAIAPDPATLRSLERRTLDLAAALRL